MPDFPAVEAALAEAMERSRVPGVGLGLLCGDERLVAGAGVTSVDHPLPVDGTTLFQIASLTKPFTATAVMRLVEAGKLDLARPVRDYLPEFRLPVEEWTGRVRVEDLLTHAGGWDGDRFLVEAPTPPTLAALVAAFHRNRQLVPPRTAYTYNNAGFSVAGRLLEVTTGQDYPSALRELVLEPLGMSHSFFRSDEVLTHRVAAPHVVGPKGAVVLRGGGWQPGWELLPSDLPAGGLVSCVEDLLVWARFHLGDGRAADGTPLLEPGTLRRMQTEVWPGGCNDDAVGIPWMLHDWGGARFFGHGGHTAGYLSEIAMRREDGFACVVLTSSVNDGGLIDDVRESALSACLGIRCADPAPVPDPPADLAAYTGRYEHAFAVLHVGAGDAPGELRLEPEARPPDPRRWQPPPATPMRLAFIGDDRCIALEPEVSRGDRFDFGRDERGRVAWLRSGGRIAPRSEPDTPPHPREAAGA